ncbi:hypothetical protein [Salinarimonas sp.]|uniref:hypothetical protein n=1 Tax=Salinarimonas sp. TaxID=2766526 RepID=UPI0032D938FB
MTRRFACFLAALLLVAPAAAQESAYTTLAFETGCRVVSESGPDEPPWVELICDGFRDYPVHVSDDGERMSLAYGFAPDERDWMSFQTFNRVHDTIEWRLAGGRPVATIHRWFVSDLDGGERQVLVVSRVWQPDGAPGCRVGFVDAQANADANVLAREIADTHAAGFACGKEIPAWRGATTPATPAPAP